VDILVIKHLVKRITPSWMIDWISRVELIRNITGIGYFGLNKMDRKIVEYLPARDGFFVELGANDGITQSNTYHFERFRNYSGILIEPIPDKFIECRRNRSSRNFFVNCACVGFGFTGNFVNLVYSNLMTTTLDGTSDILDRYSHALSGAQFIKEQTYEFQIQARTLNSILIEAKAPNRIDFLSLDVEGSELEVLKGVNFESYTFSIICVESRDISRISDYLSDKNYELVKELSVHDYLFRFKDK
jgi:FkbM family methyltransferase